MPSSPNYKRDYKAEYEDHHSSTKAKKERAARNKAARAKGETGKDVDHKKPLRSGCLLYTSPSPRDRQKSRMPSSA